MAGAGVMTSLPTSLTLRDASSVLAALRSAFAAEDASVWRIDAAPVTQLDTSALAVLLECARMAAAGQRRVEIVAAPARLLDLARLYGVDGLLGMAAAPAAPVATSGTVRPAAAAAAPTSPPSAR